MGFCGKQRRMLSSLDATQCVHLYIHDLAEIDHICACVCVSTCVRTISTLSVGIKIASSIF